MPLVSVIIPVFNAQRTVAVTLRSLLEQSLTDLEVIAVDDGSTDDSPGILADFAWRDPRVRVVRQPNRGLAAARNTGLGHATGDYVHFLDADDWLYPLGLERLLQAAEWGGLGAACGQWSLHGADRRPLGVVMPTPAQVVSLEHLLEGNRLAPHSHIIRRDLLDGHRFDESLRVVEDYDLWLRLASRGVRWSTVEETVAAYRVRPGSLSKNPRLMLDTLVRVMGRTHADPRALARAVRGSALFYATTAALSDRSERFGTAEAMLRATLDGPAAFSAAELGAAAHWSLVFGFGLSPADLGETYPRWLPRLRAWWESLGLDACAEALGSLALEAVPPSAVGEAMLGAVTPGTPAVLAGALGSNGRVIQALARERGIRLVLRDDRLRRAGIDLLIEASASVLVAPLNDEPIVRRLPPGLRIIRWTETRDRLAAALRGRLTGAASGDVAASA